MGIGRRLGSVPSQVRRRYWVKDRAAEYARLLHLARDSGYELVTLADFASATASPAAPRSRMIGLRHDVDICDSAGNQVFYELELAAGARSTFYFRWSTASSHRALIRQLLADRFEVGYHYEEAATVIKRRTLSTRAEVEAHRDEIADLMRARCTEFRRRWNPDLVSGASHGDWANRRLGIANHELVTPELLAACGLSFEAYGEAVLGRADVYVSDVASPPLTWARDYGLDAAVRDVTLIFLVVVVTLPAFAAHAGAVVPVTVLAALLITLIPTTIGGLLSAIGIAGMDRLVKFNVLATSGRAVEAAGDVDVLLLDKTGTITLGDRMATAFLAAPGVSEREVAEAALLASLADETPEGRSIVKLAREKLGDDPVADPQARFVPFSAQTRISGVDLDARRIRKGAVDSVRMFLGLATIPAAVAQVVERIASTGGTPLAVAEIAPAGPRLLGVIHLKDVVKAGIRERFAELRRMGVRTVMVTGDNRLTAAAIAAEAGVDDFLAEATPEDKLAFIRTEQGKGKLVAMCGDGTNDAPALAQADVGMAMQTGTQAAREAGNMVDLDSNPTKLIEVVGIGKQLLITRGALTTFSIANDVAKYFAIIPALFLATYPELGVLNLMTLATPQSAILSAVIFNALIIVVLIPLALRGIAYRPAGAGALLRRNLLVYGLGGLVVPFVGIKLVDLVVTALHLA